MRVAPRILQNSVNSVWFLFSCFPAFIYRHNHSLSSRFDLPYPRGVAVHVAPPIPSIRGDGTGPDIWAASARVFDAAVEKAFSGQKKISWFEVFAGQAAKDKFDEWLP